MLKYYNVLFVCMLSLFSCHTNTGKAGKETSRDSTTSIDYQKKTGLEAEPVLEKTDSVQILYFDDPDGDSSRYTRFFTYTNTRDSSIINSLLEDLKQPFQQHNEVKKCRSEGKIYLFGNDEPLKTIYYSTRCDSCCYTYFIKDGAFLYFPLSKKLRTFLTGNKSQAVKPVKLSGK